MARIRCWPELCALALHYKGLPKHLLLFRLTDIGSLEDELSVRLCFPLLIAELEFSAAVTGKVFAVSLFVKTCTKSSKPPFKLLLMSSISPTDKIADASHEESLLSP